MDHLARRPDDAILPRGGALRERLLEVAATFARQKTLRKNWKANAGRNVRNTGRNSIAWAACWAAGVLLLVVHGVQDRLEPVLEGAVVIVWDLSQPQDCKIAQY